MKKAISTGALALVVMTSALSSMGCTGSSRACGGARWTEFFGPSEPGLRTLAEAKGLWLGAAVACPTLGEEDPYGETLAREFNSLTPENVMKWRLIHPKPQEWTVGEADAMVAFARRQEMSVKGHALVWHEELPDYITEDLEAEELERLMVAHVDTLVRRYAGDIRAWDVVNEAIADTGGYRETIWMDTLGVDFIKRAFEVARQGDPEAELFYNDYGTEGLNQKSDDVYALMETLIEMETPIDGVGIQFHLDAANLPPWEDVRANFERLGALGLKVAVTELDVRIATIEGTEAERFEIQKDIYKEVVEICLSYDFCDEVSLWGFTDSHTWIDWFWGLPDDPLPFDEDYQAKPAYFGIQEALGG